MSLTGNTEVKNNIVGNIHLIKTINGYSAYEIAVKHGFTGSEEEWLASIKGEKGDKGVAELHGELDALGERIMNVADPEEDGDATPKGWADENYISKATSLYGTETDIDRLIEPGFYYGENVTNAPFQFMYLEVIKGNFPYVDVHDGTSLLNQSYFYQKAFDFYTGKMAVRYTEPSPGRFAGIEWEYENPSPIWLAGAGRSLVYKTTEKFWNKPVYTAVVYIDNFEDGKEINISGDATDETGKLTSGIQGQVIRYQGFLFGSNHEYTKTLPYIYSLREDDMASAWLTFKNNAQHDGRKIKMQMHGGNYAFDVDGEYVCNQGYVQIWFVKP